MAAQSGAGGENDLEEEKDAGVAYNAEEMDKELDKQAYRYHLQFRLHSLRDRMIRTAELLKKDDELVNKFNIITADFHSKLQGRDMAVNFMTNLTQDALVNRIQNFPAAIDRNEL